MADLLPVCACRITEEGVAPGRVDWAREEFDRLLSLATPDAVAPGENERWRKLRGLGPLDRKRLAIVRELYHWRDRTAAEVNRPARTIVRDDLLIEIARCNPTKGRDLQMIRGLGAPLSRRHRRRRRGRAVLPAEQWPDATECEQDPPQVGLVANVLNAVLADFCTREYVPRALWRQPRTSRHSSAPTPWERPCRRRACSVRGWRATHVLPVLQAMLEGKRLLCIADLASDAPFAYADASPP